MLTYGHTCNPVITGSSVHNQRIERLWRDVYRCVLSLFYQLFYFLEDTNKLDPTSDVDLFCLHYIYVPKINNALKMFTDGWNSHALTTEHSMTPSHMFTAGTLMSGRGLVLPSDFDSTDVADLVDLEAITVPCTNCPLNHQQLDQLEALVEAGSHDENYEIELYNDVRGFVYEQLYGQFSDDQFYYTVPPA